MPLSIAYPSIYLAAEPESTLKPEAEPEQQGQGAKGAGESRAGTGAGRTGEIVAV